ncbi:MAG: hypothetical protein ACE5H8_00985 [Alphaproteobacteria bacterium]
MMTKAVEAPFLVALNPTRRCNLKCAHCYLDAGTRRRFPSAFPDTGADRPSPEEKVEG